MLPTRSHIAWIYPTPTASNDDLSPGQPKATKPPKLSKPTYEFPQLQCWAMVRISASGSKRYVAVSAAEPSPTGVQAPLKVLFRLPAAAQLNTSLLAMLRSVKDGPVSDGGEVADPGASEAGTISYLRCQFSSCHDWYRLALSAQAALASRRAGACLVVTLATPLRAPAFTGMQRLALSAVLVQFISSVVTPVARASDLNGSAFQHCGGSESRGNTPLSVRAGKGVRQVHGLGLPVHGEGHGLVVGRSGARPDTVAPYDVASALVPACPHFGPFCDALKEAPAGSRDYAGGHCSESVALVRVGAIVSHFAHAPLVRRRRACAASAGSGVLCRGGEAPEQERRHEDYKFVSHREEGLELHRLQIDGR